MLHISGWYLILGFFFAPFFFVPIMAKRGELDEGLIGTGYCWIMAFLMYGAFS